MNAICISGKRLANAGRDMFLCLAVFVGLCGVAHCSSGCQESQTPTESERNYTTRIIACAATAGYPGHYDEAADMRCRRQVDSEYLFTGGKDAGNR